MLLEILLSDASISEKLLALLVSIVTILPALTFHEWAHGYVAYKLGDKTAKADGRLSLNPLDHLDPIGSLMLLLVGFGWAKPVPVNTRHFKKPRRDFALTSFAGPLANFIVAFISVLLLVLSGNIFTATGFNGITAAVIQMVFEFSAVYNIGLGLFNLIPLPPLDGSNIVMCLLPNKIAAKYSQLRYYMHYVFIGLIILRRIPYLSIIPEIVFYPVTEGTYSLLLIFGKLADLIISPFFG